MIAGQNISVANTGLARSGRSSFLLGFYLTCGVAMLTLIFALALPKGYPLAFIGDSVQNILLIAAVILAFQNARNTRSQFRLFWLLVLIGMGMWLIAQIIWCAYRLLPGATPLYDYHFNVAHAIGNQLFALVTGLAFFRASGSWRRILGVFFFVAVCYAIGEARDAVRDGGAAAADVAGLYAVIRRVASYPAAQRGAGARAQRELDS